MATSILGTQFYFVLLLEIESIITHFGFLVDFSIRVRTGLFIICLLWNRWTTALEHLIDCNYHEVSKRTKEIFRFSSVHRDNKVHIDSWKINCVSLFHEYPKIRMGSCRAQRVLMDLDRPNSSMQAMHALHCTQISNGHFSQVSNQSGNTDAKCK